MEIKTSKKINSIRTQFFDFFLIAQSMHSIRLILLIPLRLFLLCRPSQMVGNKESAGLKAYFRMWALVSLGNKISNSPTPYQIQI